MFAKIKESKFFKSLSENLCSIEIVETKNNFPVPAHYSHLHAPSDPRPNEADKTTRPAS